jgi:hypothetical protein
MEADVSIFDKESQTVENIQHTCQFVTSVCDVEGSMIRSSLNLQYRGTGARTLLANFFHLRFQ